MEAIYPYFLVIHVICAIIFLGFIFTEVVLLSRIRKILGDEIADSVYRVVLSRGTKIMPLCVVLLVLSGGAMISRYIGVEKGFFDTTLQQFLVIKMLLALLIVLVVAISLISHATKRRNPLRGYGHLVIFALGFGVVFLAKMAFYW